jgi:hypothetical protein
VIKPTDYIWLIGHYLGLRQVKHFVIVRQEPIFWSVGDEAGIMSQVLTAFQVVMQPQRLELISRVLSVRAQWGDEESFDDKGALVAVSMIFTRG